MFEPKHLYTVKSYCWLVFATKEVAAAAAAADRPVRRARAAPTARATAAANYWSKQLDCLVTFIEPESNFMVVEVGGNFVRVVGNKVGWIIADMSVDWVRDCFEEITG